MRMFKEMRREVGHGGAVPHGWGLAWYEPQRRMGVYYPVPLHWVLRGLREFGYRLRIALHAPRMERAEVYRMQRSQRERERLAEEYARGYMSGWHECFEACLDAVEEEISRVDETYEASSWACIDPKARLKN